MTRTVLTALAVGAGCALAGCGGDEQSAQGAGDLRAPTPTPSSASRSPGVELTVTGLDFPDLTVSPGATVVVRNADDVPHNVVAENGAFRTEDLPAGAEGDFRAPAAPGRYAFTCTLQPGMHGELTVTGDVVSSPSGPGTTAPPDPTTTRPGARVTERPGTRSPSPTVPTGGPATGDGY